MQQSNFINVFLARHVSGTYVHHQEHLMLLMMSVFHEEDARSNNPQGFHLYT